MTAPYSGGFVITDVIFESPFSLRILFTSTYSSTYQYQAYVNRTLSGVTDVTTDREVICNCLPSDWPQIIQLLAVDPEEADTDYGSYLPPRPYNQVKITFTTSGWTDAKYIEITACAEADGAIDYDNVLAKVLFDTNREYTFLTDPREGTGVHSFAVAGLDGTLPDGNRGTELTVSQSLYSTPPDFTLQDDDTRFAVTVESQVLTVNFTEAI